MPDSGRCTPGVHAANFRVQRALADNKRAEILTTILAASIFLPTAVVLATAFWIETPVSLFGGLALAAVFQRAIRQILIVRRNNLVLQSLPVIMRVLPPEEAALEMMARLR